MGNPWSGNLSINDCNELLFLLFLSMKMTFPGEGPTKLMSPNQYQYEIEELFIHPEFFA